MKNGIIILLLLTCSLSYGQKCNYDYEKSDPFTGKKMVGIKTTISWAWKMILNKSDENYSISLFVNFPGVKEEIIQKGDTLMLALDGAEPVIFIAQADAQPQSNVVGSGSSSNIQTFYTAFYEADIDKLNQISQNIVTACRIYFGELHYTVNVKKRNGKKIMKAARCIQQ